jgi:hypothetical protein
MACPLANISPSTVAVIRSHTEQENKRTKERKNEERNKRGKERKEWDLFAIVIFSAFDFKWLCGLWKGKAGNF